MIHNGLLSPISKLTVGDEWVVIHVYNITDFFSHILFQSKSSTEDLPTATYTNIFCIPLLDWLPHPLNGRRTNTATVELLVQLQVAFVIPNIRFDLSGCDKSISVRHLTHDNWIRLYRSKVESKKQPYQRALPVRRDRGTSKRARWETIKLVALSGRSIQHQHLIAQTILGTKREVSWLCSSIYNIWSAKKDYPIHLEKKWDS